jgi:hypothetical protein
MKGVGFAGQKRYCIREITKEEFQLANKVGTVKAGLVESY